eukprot:CAMPEP_0196664954 /NCGR_PEP_ID=MMETSP1086-20130531/59113_1 /TAXON_ID=77921 /ORGANISM="Cyanoptyche  gloeocystis , Strain SAG4.97" /LENGTH=131 /DNA_ID=CAMNT_0042001485 /DNA_START=1076 /DNA_END=1472 /DNA_ORIENTATION=+
MATDLRGLAGSHVGWCPLFAGNKFVDACGQWIRDRAAEVKRHLGQKTAVGKDLKQPRLETGEFDGAEMETVREEDFAGWKIGGFSQMVAMQSLALMKEMLKIQNNQLLPCGTDQKRLSAAERWRSDVTSED